MLSMATVVIAVAAALGLLLWGLPTLIRHNASERVRRSRREARDGR